MESIVLTALWAHLAHLRHVTFEEICSWVPQLTDLEVWHELMNLRDIGAIHSVVLPDGAMQIMVFKN